MTQNAFAFAANTQAKDQRISSGTRGDHATSNNAHYVPSACLTCGVGFVRQWKNHKFCSHACYNRSLCRPIEQRLWAKVQKTSTCWNWTGARTGSSSVRHGQILWLARYRSPQKVHRVVWELANGPIPIDRQINHRCDNPICVRLDHLYLGTQRENMQDASGRKRFTVPRTRTLSLFDRLTIYKTPKYRGVCVALARQYGVTKACISTIRRERFLGSGVWFGTKESA